MKLTKLNFSVLAILIAASYLILLSGQDKISALVREDGIVENIGTLGLLISSIFFFVVFLHTNKPEHRKSHTFLIRLSLLGLGLIFLFGFGEEISWGQRIFDLETPAAWAELNNQDETNLHNLKIFNGTVFLISINCLQCFGGH